MATGANGHVLVAGGAGYIGSVLTRELLRAGYRVRVLDSLLYGNGESLASVAEAEGFSFLKGDLRSRDDVRASLDGITAVVALAALVGDPVCSRNPDLAIEINLDGVRCLLNESGAASVERFVFASTCSNYGMRPDSQPATENDKLQPLSLYAETKVQMEREILERGDELGPVATVLRIATAYGISPRMRFDLTVSEFTRELSLGRTLEVYDADTWRPYSHVEDTSAAIVSVLQAPSELVAGEVFNVGSDDGNHTKRMIVEAALAVLDGDGEVSWSEGGSDPRNYRVSFAKLRERLGFTARHSVLASIERLVAALEEGIFSDVDQRPLFYRNFELARPVAAGEGAGGGDAG